MARTEVRWRDTASVPLLPDSAVHVWRADLDIGDGDHDTFQAVLSEDERARANAFLHDESRRRFVAARGILRGVLSGYVGLAPGALRFLYGPHGKPSLAAGPGNRRVEFNLAHSGGLLLLAVAPSGLRIGLDVERDRRGVSTLEIARQFFSAAEADALAALSKRERAGAFLACWTAKEAYAKATGSGAGARLDAVEVLPGAPPRLLGAGSPWTFLVIPVSDEHRATLVTERPPASVRLFER